MKLKLLSAVRRFFPKRVGHQIFLILFFLVVIPLLILGLLLLHTSQKAIKITVLRDHKEIAIHATGEIREHVDGTRQSFFVTAAILGSLHADRWRQETTIVELALRNPAFQRISSLDIQGREIVTSELGTPLKNYGQQEAFQEARRGHSYLSLVKISDNHIPFLTIAEPIKELGKVKGVLLADLSLRSVWEMVDKIHVGKTGKAYLIDQQGRIIAHPDKKLVLQNVNMEHTQVLTELLTGRSGNFEEADHNGQRWLTSYAPIEKFNWGLIISQPEVEAYAYLKVMKVQSLILLAWSIIATLLISFIMAHYMSQPLKHLIDGTHRIAQGNFSQYYRIRSRNEIDRLFFSFNRMARKLRQAQEMEKLSMIGKAATVIAHELKNSLQLINTFVNILPERHRDKEFIKEFANTIPKELDSWNNLLKNMMAYSGTSQCLMSDIDVNKVVEEVVSLMSLKMRQMTVAFKVDVYEGIPLIRGNEEKLKQVFLNLLTNALEATPCGGEIAIGTRLRKEPAAGFPGYVEIEVVNTGERIPEDTFSRIFEPFYTTKKSGLGLGLSISKEIIKHHNGVIRVISDQTKTSFIVALPVNSPAWMDHVAAARHF